MEKTQREYYLNEQLKAIQKELGEGDDGRDENSELEERIKKTALSKEAREKATAELKKLRSMSPMSAEATVVRNYLDWMLGIPWKKRTRIKKDIRLAGEILDADHYGLEKVKDRILEYLAVQQRTNKLRGPILCRSATHQQATWPDPVLGGPARCWENVAGQVDRPGDRTELRSHVARRCP
jgi:ATP-dependent Lon protease